MLSSLYHVCFVYIYTVYRSSLDVSLVLDVVWVKDHEIGKLGNGGVAPICPSVLSPPSST